MVIQLQVAKDGVSTQTFFRSKSGTGSTLGHFPHKFVKKNIKLLNTIKFTVSLNLE